jgi:competence protein ComEA
VLLTSLAWLIVAGGAILAWRRPQPVAFQVQPPPATATPAPTPTPAPIQIELAGAVQQPGVYELPASARVADAIAAAGGLAPNADEEALSLARALQDGEKLVAPTARPAQPASAVVTFSTPEPAAARSGGSDLGSAGPVNLNSASAQELEALPAIGPVTAQAIVDYRTANGPFRAIEEITQVKGIGAATLEKLKPLITVGE